MPLTTLLIYTITYLSSQTLLLYLLQKKRQEEEVRLKQEYIKTFNKFK